MLGKEHPSILNSIKNLILMLRSLGKYKEAEQIYQQTLELMEKMLGKEHPSILNSINNLTLILRSLGKYKEAE